MLNCTVEFTTLYFVLIYCISVYNAILHCSVLHCTVIYTDQHKTVYSKVQEYLKGKTNIDLTTSIPIVCAIFSDRHIPLVNMQNSLVNINLHNLNSISLESSVLQSGYVGPEHPRTIRRSIRDYSAFQLPPCMSSPAKSTKRRRADDGGRITKKHKNVSWRDLGGSSSSTNDTGCIRSDRSMCHICNKIFKKMNPYSYCTVCNKKIHKNCKKDNLTLCPDIL